jgi:hypothetical protein
MGSKDLRFLPGEERRSEQDGSRAWMVAVDRLNRRDATTVLLSQLSTPACG